MYQSCEDQLMLSQVNQRTRSKVMAHSNSFTVRAKLYSKYVITRTQLRPQCMVLDDTKMRKAYIGPLEPVARYPM